MGLTLKDLEQLQQPDLNMERVDAVIIVVSPSGEL